MSISCLKLNYLSTVIPQTIIIELLARTVLLKNHLPEPFQQKNKENISGAFNYSRRLLHTHACLGITQKRKVRDSFIEKLRKYKLESRRSKMSGTCAVRPYFARQIFHSISAKFQGKYKEQAWVCNKRREQLKPPLMVSLFFYWYNSGGRFLMEQFLSIVH